MARGYTKEQRAETKRLAAEHTAPHLVVENNRIYLTQRLDYGGEVKVDATGLYLFLKEMFTTDWQAQAVALNQQDSNKEEEIIMKNNITTIVTKLPEADARELLAEVFSDLSGYTINLDSVNVNVDQKKKTITFRPAYQIGIDEASQA